MNTNIYTENNPTNAPTWDAVNAPLRGASAVSWGAIIAGAAGAAALSLILLILGTGLGLSSVSPWAQDGVSAKAFGVSTIVWVIFTSLVASALGGYLAGRLRTKWVAVHTDEVHFRDTAHGFLAWAVASLATATLLTSVIGSIVNAGVQAGANVAGAMAGAAGAAASTIASPNQADAADNGVSVGPMSYYIDALLRREPIAIAYTPTTSSVEAATATSTDPAIEVTSAEITRIFIRAISEETLAPEDVRYLGRVVAQRTGKTLPESEQRVTEIYSRLQTELRDAKAVAKNAADKARKASAYTALWLFISLLIGAFIASLSATYGGRQRDA
jgi:hypothetical protein